MNENTTLTEARAIARGQSLMLPTVEHLKALDNHAALLERTIIMAVEQQRKDMADLESWANTQARKAQAS